LTLVGLALWAAFAVSILISFRVLRAHMLPREAPLVGLPTISVVVPARNEAARVGVLVGSVLAQDHPGFELIVVDDRSTDQTSDVALRAAGGDTRARVIRVEERPAGWQGKLHAIAAGVEVARGEWLLFLDADQRLASPDVLRRLVADFVRKDVVAIALIARNVRQKWWDRWWILPMVNNPLTWGVVLAVQRLRPASPWLIGSLAMRRATYDALGGASAAARCAAGAYDDWGWAHCLAAHGQRSRMVYVAELEDSTNFESIGDVLEGLARWLAGLFSYRKGGWVSALAIALSLAVLPCVALLVAAEALAGRMPDPGLIGLAAIIPTIGAGHCRWNREPMVFSLGFYAVAPLVLLAIVAAAWARLRNRVRWRGDTMRVAGGAPDASIGSPEAGR
jgi:hypothetical protein